MRIESGATKLTFNQKRQLALAQIAAAEANGTTIERVIPQRTDLQKGLNKVTSSGSGW